MHVFVPLVQNNPLEQVNHSMKVTRALGGITLNPSTGAKFSLIDPELARLTDEAKSIAAIYYTMK